MKAGDRGVSDRLDLRLRAFCQPALAATVGRERGQVPRPAAVPVGVIRLAVHEDPWRMTCSANAAHGSRRCQVDTGRLSAAGWFMLCPSQCAEHFA